MESTSLLREICITTSERNDVVVEESHEIINRLSFSSYLPDDENYNESPVDDSSPSAQVDSTFEFFATTLNHSNNNNHQRSINKNEYQKRDYFANKSTPPCKTYVDSDNPLHGNNGIKHSLSLPVRSSSEVGLQRIVNFSSLTSMSAKSKRRMFMFGPVKFKPEMEITAIRQRLKAEPPRPLGGDSGGRRRSSASWQLTRVLGCMPLTTGGGF